MDRAYIDFARLYNFTLSSAFYVVRTKSNVLAEGHLTRARFAAILRRLALLTLPAN